MYMGLPDTTRAAIVNLLRDIIDSGAGPGQIRFYDGAIPAPGGAATTLLGTVLFADPSGDDSTDGVFTADTLTEDASADATGTATWARITNSTGTIAFDVDVTASGLGGFIELNTVSLVAGGPIRITAFGFTMPDGT